MIRIYLAMIGLLFSSYSSAGVISSMKKYVDSSGAQYNVTSPDHYKLQGGHYAHGGSLVMRNPVKNIQPFSVDNPSISASCTGISINAGGLGIISKKELVAALKNVLSGVPAFAFMLGLQIVSPQMKNILGWLNDLRIKAHQISANTCDLTSLLVGGMVSQHEATAAYWCAMDAVKHGKLSGRAAAYMCGRDPSYRSGVERLAQSRGKWELTDNYNIAFEAMKRSDVLKSLDDETKALVMTITGSFVVKDGKPYAVHGDHKNGMIALYNGGPIELINCADDACLAVRKTELLIPENKSFTSNYYSILVALAEALADGDGIDNSTKAKVNVLLSNTNLPIYDNMQAHVIAVGSVPYGKIQQYSEVLALDVISNYLDMIIREMKKGLASLEGDISQDSVVKNFKKGLDDVIRHVREYQGNIRKKVGTNYRMDQETRQLRQFAVSGVDVSALM